MLVAFSPALRLIAENTLADGGSKENVRLAFQDMKDF